jgi:hypothetical protein
MNAEYQGPFETIESAQEFLRLLVGAVVEAKRDLHEQIDEETTPRAPRKKEALQVALFSLNKLEKHIQISLCTLNDLRSLRRVMWGERRQEALSVREA